MKKMFLHALRYGVVISGLGVLLIAGIYAFLPDPGKLKTENPETSAYLQLKCSSDCSLKWTPLSEISYFVKKAVVLAEDSNFFNDGPVSLPALKQALRRNLYEGRIVWGGSTITMQLARNLYLYPDRTLKRKILEILLAIKIDRELTKDRILEIYLNVVEWAPDIFGVTAASQHYFSKLPKDLSPLEAAFLASILPGPKIAHEPLIRNRFSKKGAIIFDRLVWPFLPKGRTTTEKSNSCPERLEENQARMVDNVLATLFGRFGLEIISADGVLLDLDNLMASLDKEQELFVQNIVLKIKAGRPPITCRRGQDGKSKELRGWYQEKGNLTINYWLSKSDFPAFQLLMAKATTDGIPLLVRSAYRSPGYQTYLILKELRRQDYCISSVKRILKAPDRSEHTCLDNTAIDFSAPDGSGLAFSQTSTFRWLERNAPNFGFTMSYHRDDPNGIGYEPWHWRFTGEKTRYVSDS